MKTYNVSPSTYLIDLKLVNVLSGRFYSALNTLIKLNTESDITKNFRNHIMKKYTLILVFLSITIGINAQDKTPTKQETID